MAGAAAVAPGTRIEKQKQKPTNKTYGNPS
jgi:hypothetical protein